MECRDVRELADSFVSGELLVETNHELLRHLEICPACRADIAGRRAIRDRLRAAFSRADQLRPRPELTQELLTRLRPPPPRISRRSVLQTWWALAAGLVAAAGGGWVVRRSSSRSRLALLARDAAGDHLNCAITFNLAERPIPLEDAARRYGAPYGALATFTPPAVDAPLELLERHSCVYGGRRFGHVVFRYQGTITSLLVTAATPPAVSQLEPTEGGAAVASLPAGRFVAFVVADLDRERVLRLAQTLAAPLSQHLA